MLIDILVDCDDGGRSGDAVVIRRLSALTPTTANRSALGARLDQPIRNIVSRAASIRRGPARGLPENYARFGGDIQQAGEHLARVVGELGNLPEHRAGMPDQDAVTSLDVMPIIDEALALSQPPADARGIELFVETREPGLPIMVSASEGKLRQIIINLLSNAIKFSPRGTSVFVHAAAGDQVRISVSDEGVGIASEDTDRIFSRFERLGRAEEGSGLGLYIARRHAQDMGGRLFVDDSIKGGATFTLVLRTAVL
ncbi:MAG: HAMP domain-containing sensor histidine kinase [Pacificimonas sp.]